MFNSHKPKNVTAESLAEVNGIDPKSYRAALRAEGLIWHRHNDGWTVVSRSPEHVDMIRVLLKMISD